MNSEKYNRRLWIAAAGAVFAWPFGEAVGLVLATGQDGPGSALAQGFGAIATVAVWVISAAAIIWNMRKGAAQIDKAARVTAALAIAFLPVATILSAASHQNYDLRVWNETGARIEDVSINMIGQHYTFGVMTDGVTATRASQQDRPSGNAKIRWTGEGGQSHTVDVDVSQIVPRRFNKGVLTFTILGDDNVRVGFFIRQELTF